MKLFEKLGKKMGDYISETYTWPPNCVGVFYQPERPILHWNDSEADNAQSNTYDKQKEYE